MYENLDTLIEAASKARLEGMPLQKTTFLQATGLVQYDLQRPALSIVPILSPLVNETPRVMGDGGTATNWKAFTALDSALVGLGVAESKRATEMNVTVTPFVATYKGLGMEASVSFEAELAAMGYDNARARMTEKLLQSFKVAEEKVLLDSRSATGLGVTPTPAGTPSTSSGAIASGTYWVYCVALTGDGYRRSSVAGGLPGQLVTVPTDGSAGDNYGGGNAHVSVHSADIVLGSTGNIAATVAAVPGAAAYAWYYGLKSGGAATALLTAITTVNAYTFTGSETQGTQAANDAKIGTDFSQNTLLYDGILSQVIDGGGYFKSLDNGTLTGDSAAGIVQIEDANQAQWNTYRVTPDVWWVSSQQARDLKAKVISGGGSPLFRFFGSSSGDPNVVAGRGVAEYFDSMTGKLQKIRVHPFITPGTMMGLVNELPGDVYPSSGIGNVRQIKTRRDYYQIEWPLRSRKYEHGIYYDGVMQHYFPAVDVVIKNIAKG